MNASQYEFILKEISLKILKKDTILRPSIKPDERLAVTLRYLATGESFKSLEYSLPPAKSLPKSEKLTPYVFTGDDAFPLITYLLKPYPRTQLNNEQRIFNYRLSLKGRTSENGFGIIGNKWRVFRSPICLKPEKVTNMVLAVLVLHNLLR